MIIEEKGKQILGSVKTGYEAFVRIYIDVLRTYAIRHPFGVTESEFQLALNKAQEAEEMCSILMEVWQLEKLEIVKNFQTSMYTYY